MFEERNEAAFAMEEEARQRSEKLSQEEERINLIRELQEENARLKKQVRDLKNKLYESNRTINRMHRDNFESVDFHDDRRG